MLTSEEIALLAAALAPIVRQVVREEVGGVVREEMAGVVREVVREEVAPLELRLRALEIATATGFRQVLERLSTLEDRVAKLEDRFEGFEDRLGRVVREVTRGRTSDSERIAALEARVAELEAKLDGKH